MSAYTDKLAAGLCGKCGKNPKPTKGSLCDTCREKERLRMEKRRQEAEAKGYCPCCCLRPIVEGKSRCQKCLNSGAASVRRGRATKKRKGICAHCHEPVIPGKTVCEKHAAEMRATSKERYHNNKAEGKCGHCNNPPVPGHVFCQYHLDQQAQQRVELRLEVLNAYGGPKCAWCGETELRFLELDHIDGGGRQHLREINSGGRIASGTALYCWLKKNNFPAGFRVLCRSCNNKAHMETCKQHACTVTHQRGHNIRTESTNDSESVAAPTP